MLYSIMSILYSIVSILRSNLLYYCCLYGVVAVHLINAEYISEYLGQNRESRESREYGIAYAGRSTPYEERERERVVIKNPDNQAEVGSHAE